MPDEYTVDFDRPDDLLRAIRIMQGMRGVRRISIMQFRPRRSDRQNRYYWPCFVNELGKYLREQGQPITDEEAHELLKVKFLRRPVYSPSTGELLGYAIRSTTDLTTAEFNSYLDHCAAWLLDMFGIVVPDPSEYHEKEGAEHASRVA